MAFISSGCAAVAWCTLRTEMGVAFVIRVKTSSVVSGRQAALCDSASRSRLGPPAGV